MHRVQRVPATETQGRIHTSTATVAVLPEADDVDVHIEEKDLEISIAASGGPGGQGVNTTNSAVQILHKPSGHHRQVPGRALAAQEQGEGAQGAPSRLLELEREQQEARRGRDAPEHGVDRRASPEDPHLQLPAEPRDRPPHPPHARTSSIASSRAISTSW